jgi:ATP-dependent Lhr-like helicase
MLEIGRETVYGEASDALLAEAADALVREAMMSDDLDGRNGGR